MLPTRERSGRKKQADEAEQQQFTSIRIKVSIRGRVYRHDISLRTLPFPIFFLVSKTYGGASLIFLIGMMFNPSLTLEGISTRSFSFSEGMRTVLMPLRCAASNFSLSPPIA